MPMGPSCGPRLQNVGINGLWGGSLGDWPAVLVSMRGPVGELGPRWRLRFADWVVLLVRRWRANDCGGESCIHLDTCLPRGEHFFAGLDTCGGILLVGLPDLGEFVLVRSSQRRRLRGI